MKNNNNNKSRNEKRLGGKALSLESFCNAKSRNSGYNPSLIKKQKEFYKNAKYVSKFKKSIKRECQTGDSQTSRILENIKDEEIETRPKENKKKLSLKALSEEAEKKRAEAENARMEREAKIKEKNEEKAKAEAKRKAQRENMFKRTRSGQPVMKYRIQHMLEGLLYLVKRSRTDLLKTWPLLLPGLYRRVVLL